MSSESAVKAAERLNERMLSARLKRQIAQVRSLSGNPLDMKSALESFQEVKECFEELGVRYDLAYVMQNIGDLAYIRGEFNLALETYIEAFKIREALGAPYLHVPEDVSDTYARIGEFEEALVWADLSIESRANEPLMQLSPNFAKAYVLLCLGRLDEASEHIRIANHLVLQTGNDHWLAESYFYKGLLEKAQGDIHSAATEFERALALFEELKIHASNENSCILELARIEVSEFSPEEAPNDDGESMPWLTCLEERARKRGYPGILGEALLLKAELKLKQGMREDAIELVNEVRPLSLQPSMSFLEGRIRNFLTKTIENDDAGESMFSMRERKE